MSDPQSGQHTRYRFHRGAAVLQGIRNDVTAGNGVAAKSTLLLFVGYIVLVLVEYSGVSRELSILRTIRFSTVLSYLLLFATLARVGIGDFFQHRQTKIFIAFVVFTIASVAWAVVQGTAFSAIRPLVDYTVFFYIGLSLIDRKKRIDALSWTLALIGCYLVLRNLDKLTSSVRSGVFTAPYFMGDGNDFAWAMVVMLPLVLNLAIGPRSLFERLAGFAGAACCVTAVVGTGSRGASLGLVAMALYYLVALSRRKLPAIVLLACGAGAVLLFAPSRYFDRMQTVSEIQEDNSAQTRLRAWGAAIEMAIDYPLGVGAGNFSSAYGRFYRPPQSEVSQWGAGRWISPHSIYFRALGEYGLIGLAMLLWLLFTLFRDNVLARRAIAAKTAHRPIEPTWPGLVAMSVVGYSVCGVFLGGIAYPHLFLLAALTVGNKRFAARIKVPDSPTTDARTPVIASKLRPLFKRRQRT